MTIVSIIGGAPKLDAVARPREAHFNRTKVPVGVGVSAPAFAAIRSLAHSSIELGAEGVMIAPPPALRINDQITGYFKTRPRRLAKTILGSCRILH